MRVWNKRTFGVVLGASLLVLRAMAEDGVSRETGAARTSGIAVYKTYCAVCHGADGKGDGPLAGSLRIRPPDLTLLAKKDGGDYPKGKIHRIVDGRNPVKGHGGPDMPVWGDAFSRTTYDNDADAVRRKIESLVKYIEMLQEKETGDRR